ncbi:hypothetical protein [Mailhella sp.]
MYLSRTLEKNIRKVSDFFPVLLVPRPRKVGKTTILQACGAEGRNDVSLETLENRALAQMYLPITAEVDAVPIPYI